VSPGDDWYSQLPPKVRRAQFSAAEQAFIKCGNASLITIGPTSVISPQSQLRKSASASACFSSFSAMSDTTSPSSNYTPRPSVDSVSSKLNYYGIDPSQALPAKLVSRSHPPRSYQLPRLRRRVTIKQQEVIDEVLTPSRRPAPLQYLRDPETQMKLKLYFGSEEKFDEVLEYGFPLAPDAEEEQAEAPKPTVPQISDTRKRRALADYQKALRGDDLSFLDDSEEEDEADEEQEIERSASIADDSTNDDYILSSTLPSQDVSNSLSSSTSSIDFDSPLTPQLLASPMYPTITNSSSALPTSTSPPNHNVAGTSPSKLFSPAMLFGSDRETTLRVTLTRPEFREPEDLIYGWEQRRQQDSRMKKPSLTPIRTRTDTNASASASTTTTLESENTIIAYTTATTVMKDDDIYVDASSSTDSFTDLYEYNDPYAHDLLALAPLPKDLPDHAAIAFLTQAGKKDEWDSRRVMRDMLMRMKTSRMNMGTGHGASLLCT
jgi:hypothetical protein